MSFNAALLALSAVQAISQIGQGKAEKAEANYNATLIEGKAGLIDIQKGFENEQYIRAKGQALSTSMASVAGSGMMPTGSKLAVMLDTQKQISIDQAIGQFNYDQEKRYTMAQADAARRSGDQAVKAGYSRAFSTMLTGATQYAMTRVGTTKDNTFDAIPGKGGYGLNTPSGTKNMGTWSKLKG